MPNVQISDLPFAAIPLIGATTFFEVEVTEGGQVLSRRVAADDLTISATTLFITGTSTDDPAIAAGTFDGSLLWRNVNGLQTGVFGFNPAGDNFIWSNDAEGGFHQIAIRDGTVLAETIAAVAGGLLVNNLFTGAGLERVLTIADLFTGGLDALSDVTLTAPATGSVLFKSAGDWLNTPAITIDPAADVKLFQAGAEVFRTLPAANGGAEANNTLTGGGFERVLTTADLFTGVFIGTSTDDPTVFGGTFDGVAAWQNANLLATGAVGFEPAGDAFRVFNKTRGGDIALRVISTTPAEIDVYFYEGSAGLHLWRDNSDNRLMELRAGFNAVTLIAQQNNTPASGASQVGQFRIEISNGGAPSATFGYPESGSPSTVLQVKSFVHGGQVQLVGEDNAGVERLLLLGDPDSQTNLYQAGIAHILTQTDGAAINAPAGQDVGIGVFENFILSTTFRHIVATDITLIRNEINSGHVELRGRSSASADTLMIRMDPDDLVELFDAGVSVFRTTTAAAGGAEANNTLTGAGFERVLTTADLSGSPFTEIILTNSNAIDLVDTDVALNIGAAVPGSNPHLEIGFTVAGTDLGIQAKADATSVLELEINRLGGNVRVGSQSTSVAGATFLYASNGAAAGAVIETVISGMILEGKTGANTILDFHEVNGNLAMRAVYNGANFAFEGFVSSEEIRFQSRNSGAAVRELIFMDPDDDVEIYHPASDRVAFRTTAEGIAVLGDTATNAEFHLFSADGLTDLLEIRHQAGLTVFQAQVNQEGLSFQSRLSGGALIQVFQATNTGVAQFYQGGLIKALTQSQGFTIRGNAATNAQLLIEGSGGVDLLVLRGEAARIVLDSRVDGSRIDFVGEDTGSVTRTLMQMDPDDDVQLFDVGVSVARTQQAGLGGFEVNNTLTGAGFERVMTLTDADNLSIFDRNIADDNVPAVTFVTGVLTVTLEANSVYAVEYFLEFQTPNASGDDFVLRFDGASAGWVGDAVLVCDNDAGTETFTQDLGGAPAATTTVNSDTTSNTFCKGTGVIVTNGTPGTLELDVAKSADAGGDGTFFANSWLRVQKLA